MEKNSTEDKQNYLRFEILEQNYDANDFVEFLIGLKGEDAGNVDNWTMEELVKIVSEYKISKKEQNTLKAPPTFENYNTDTYEEIIACNKQSKTPISDCHNIEIIISE